MRGPGTAEQWAPLREAALWLLEVALAYLTSGALVFIIAGSWLQNWPGSDAGTTGHGVVLAVEIAAWGIIGTGELLLFMRLKAGRWTLPVIAAELSAAAGILLAATLQLAIHEWARVRFGEYDTEYVGPTALLPPLLLMLVIAGYRSSLPAPPAPLGTRLVTGLGALTIVGIFAVNAIGLLDGIMPGSEVLAVMVAAATIYALLMFWQAVRLPRSRKSGPAPAR